MWTRTSLAFALALIGSTAVPQDDLPPTLGDLRVLVPAYFYPVAGSPWPRLDAMAAAHPGRVAAIGNPGNGPGPTIDANYSATFASFVDSGGTLLGYVYTSYATRPLAEVLADVDTWLAWYPVDGFFLDEMENTPGLSESYYRAIYRHVQKVLPHAPVIANPGTAAPESYLRRHGKPVTSALTLFEGPAGFLAWTPEAWVESYPRAHVCALPFGIAESEWPAIVDHAWEQNCGWLYTTDDVLPNPWDTLPPWFEAFVAGVAAKH